MLRAVRMVAAMAALVLANQLLQVAPALFAQSGKPVVWRLYD